MQESCACFDRVPWGFDFAIFRRRVMAAMMKKQLRLIIAKSPQDLATFEQESELSPQAIFPFGSLKKGYV